MTNKPMLSVERDLIERAVQAIINTSQMQPALNELRALLDKPVLESQYEGMTQEQAQAVSDGVDEILHDKPAARPQGDPVVLTNAQRRAADYKEQQAFNDWAWNKQGEAIGRMDGQAAAIEAWHARAKLAEQPAPVEVVPDGYCIMPRQLTAENGAKALLLGEFKLLVTKECPECCELEEPTEGCSICDGEGEYGQKHTIPWDQLKYIYSKAVSGLAVKTESAKSR